jgi:hypothetical protein
MAAPLSAAPLSKETRFPAARFSCAAVSGAPDELTDRATFHQLRGDRLRGRSTTNPMTDNPPTARTTHRAGFLCVLVWCKACHHEAPADLQPIIEAGRGDVPLKDLRFRCTRCGSRLTDSVVMAKDGLGVQPWRAEAG